MEKNSIDLENIRKILSEAKFFIEAAHKEENPEFLREFVTRAYGHIAEAYQITD